LGLRHPDERRLVAIGGQVAVDAVVTGVQPAADEPLPERRIARIQRRLPVRVPGQQVGVLLEALGEVLLGETLQDRGVARVRLADELRRRWVEVLLPPVDGDLRLGNLRLVYDSHRSTSSWKANVGAPRATS